MTDVGSEGEDASPLQQQAAASPSAAAASPENADASTQDKVNSIQSHDGAASTGGSPSTPASSTSSPGAAASTAAARSDAAAASLRVMTHQVSVSAPTPALASMSAAGPYSWTSSIYGWVTAFALLLAVRQGRSQADADRLDVRALQSRQTESRMLSRELREKRREWQKKEQVP